MTRFARVLLLMAALGGGTLAVTAPSTTAAPQEKKKDDKKKDAKDDKKDDKKKVTGIVEVNEGKDGKFRIMIRDNDEKFLAQTTAFATKEDALKGLESIKEVLVNPKQTSKKSEKKDDK